MTPLAKDSLIKPFYALDASRSTVALGEEVIEIKRNGAVIRGIGRPELRFRPRFLLTIKIAFSEADGMEFVFDPGDVEFKYGRNFAPGAALVVDTSIRSGEQSIALEAEIVPTPQRMRFIDDAGHSIAAAVFHIVNFPLFCSVHSPSDDIIFEAATRGWRRLGRFTICDPLWKIEIQEMLESAAIAKDLEQNSGYAITHVGKIERQDGKRFSADDIETLVRKLYLFLSFVRGAWTPPILTVGLNAEGDRIYEDWSVRIGTPYERRSGWFDVHHANILASIYPGFAVLIDDDDLGKSVASALYWYLRSNRGGDGAGIDSGVILGQAALERLAWACLDSKGVGMHKPHAAGLLREALKQLDIPTLLPVELKGLQSGLELGYWSDGPEAVTRVRNELVHPKKMLPLKIGAVIPDTWNLTLWYIELIILRLAGYSGTYSNRLRSNRWVGEVERVPWE